MREATSVIDYADTAGATSEDSPLDRSIASFPASDGSACECGSPGNPCTIHMQFCIPNDQLCFRYVGRGQCKLEVETVG